MLFYFKDGKNMLSINKIKIISIFCSHDKHEKEHYMVRKRGEGRPKWAKGESRFWHTEH